MLAARQKASKSSSECSQQFFTASNEKSDFSKDLCKVLMTANIPINKVSNTEFREFLEKYILHAVPIVKVLKKNHKYLIFRTYLTIFRAYLHFACIFCSYNFRVFYNHGTKLIFNFFSSN